MKERSATIPPQGKPLLTEAIERLVQFYDEVDRKEQAAKYRRELEEATREQSIEEK
jgi:hypothetical protein